MKGPTLCESAMLQLIFSLFEGGGEDGGAVKMLGTSSLIGAAHTAVLHLP